MAKIIGYDKKESKEYRCTCPHCGAIVIFEESEIHNQYIYKPEYFKYCYSKGTCPNCGCDVIFDRDDHLYDKI